MNDKYLQYQVEDYIADDAFIQWVLSGEKESGWKEWLHHNPGVIETIEEAKSLIGQIRFKEDLPSTTRQEAIWERIDRTTSAKVIQVNPGRRIIRYAVGIAIAASLALFIFNRSSVDTKVSSFDEEHLIATLPAQSTVELVGHSSIIYNKKYWSSQRSVRLDGEAIFSVTKGVPFTVETDNGTVRVLGTKFKVISRDDTFLVIVESGRVAVTSGSDSEILTANMNFVKPGNQIDEVMLQEEITPQASTQYHFDKKNLAEVFRTIERVYGVNLIYDFDFPSLYSGSIKSTDELDSILYQVLWPLGIKYTVEGDQVYLTL